MPSSTRLTVPLESHGMQEEQYSNGKRGIVQKKKQSMVLEEREESIEASERQGSKTRPWLTAAIRPASIQRSWLKLVCLQRQRTWVPGKKKAKMPDPYVTTLQGWGPPSQKATVLTSLICCFELGSLEFSEKSCPRRWWYRRKRLEKGEEKVSHGKGKGDTQTSKETLEDE